MRTSAIHGHWGVEGGLQRGESTKYIMNVKRNKKLDA